MTTGKTVLTLASCEMKKLLLQHKYRMMPVVTAIVVIAGGMLGNIPGNLFQFTMVNYPYTILSIMTYLVVPLVIFMLVSDMLSGEMSSGEMKVWLTRPLSRIDILLGKTVAVIGYSALLLLESLLISGILSVAMGGFSAFSIGSMLLAYIISFLPLLTFIAMSVMISSSMKSGTSSFGACLLLYIALIAFGLVFSSLSPMLFTSYLGIGTMMIGSTIPVTSFLTGITLLSGYTIVFLSVAGLKFGYREF